MLKFLVIVISLAGVCGVAHAENADYGEVTLNGLAREVWPLNNLQFDSGMVCNVNGPDGYLSIRACASTACEAKRKLNRLAILEVDLTQRKGNWIKVINAHRNHTKDGVRLSQHKELTVQGWAHTGYICDFLD